MPRAKPKKPSVPPELLSPIKIPDFRKKIKLVSSPDIFEAQEASDRAVAEAQRVFIETELKRKYSILFKHYGAASDDLKQLLVHVIADFVPGFTVEEEKTVGRPEKWNLVALYELWVAVEKQLASGRFPDAFSACAALAEQDAWKDKFDIKTSSRTPKDNLYEVYMQAKRTSFVKGIENVRAHVIKEKYDGDVAADFLHALKST